MSSKWSLAPGPVGSWAPSLTHCVRGGALRLQQITPHFCPGIGLVYVCKACGALVLATEVINLVRGIYAVVARQGTADASEEEPHE